VGSSCSENGPVPSGSEEVHEAVKKLQDSTSREQGFTLVELMVAVAISLILLGAIFLTFKSQQDSYLTQDQISTMQQNLRAAMLMITKDLQMAGYYTNFDTDDYTMNWDDLAGSADPDGTDDETIRPLLYAHDNIDDSPGNKDKIRNGTDFIVIAKASDKGRQLAAGEMASGNAIDASLRDVDNLKTDKCGLLVKNDLSYAEFFRVEEDSGPMNLSPGRELRESYREGDFIFRADVVIYYVNEDNNNLYLRRKNLGNNEGAQVIAEGIDNLQFRYLLGSGTWVSDPNTPPGTSAADVRAVEISVLARSAQTFRGYRDITIYHMGGANRGPFNDGYRRKLLTSIVETRNIGLPK
jgi:prepilin-type N-terminal cleavage/methylation domain-containing protein